MSVTGTEGALVPRWRRADWGALLVVLVVLLSSATSLGNGFAYDDVVMIQGNPSVTQLQGPFHYLSTPYWGWGTGGSLYRPWVEGAWALQWAVGSGDPWVFHAVNLVLYAALSLLVLRFARYVLRPGAALLVGVLWAGHPVHVEAVANCVGQAELWAGLGILAASLSMLSLLTKGSITGIGVLGVCGGVVCALLSKESGIIAPALLTMIWWFHPQRGSWTLALRGRVAVLVRSCWYLAVIYFVVRMSVLGRITGDEPHFALAALTIGERVTAALGFLPTYARLFVWPFRLYADYSPPFLPARATLTLYHLWALGLLAVFGVVALRLARRRHLATVAVLWVPLTMLPISNLLFPTGVLVAERTLLIPSVGALISIGLIIDGAWRRHRAQIGGFMAGALGLALATLVVAFVVRSAGRQRDWFDTPTLFAASYVDSPPNFRLERVIGGLLLKVGRVREAEAHFRTADRLVPNDPLVVFGLGRALYGQGRCAEAVDALVRVPVSTPLLAAHLTRVACLYRLGRVHEGRRVVRDALAAGLEQEPLRILARTGDSVLALNLRGNSVPLTYAVDDNGAIRRLIPRDGVVLDGVRVRGAPQPSGVAEQRKVP
ncbi:MAG: hypothetical protein ACO3F5_00990 [Gemmatimonadaceae bacterium]